MKKIILFSIIIPIIIGIIIYNNLTPLTFWVVMTVYFIFLIYSIKHIYKTFQERYYVLNNYGKEAYFEGNLSKDINNELSYVCYISSFRGCCDYLNSFKDNTVGLIVDENVQPVGRLNNNNEWIPVR